MGSHNTPAYKATRGMPQQTKRRFPAGRTSLLIRMTFGFKAKMVRAMRVEGETKYLSEFARRKIALAMSEILNEDVDEILSLTPTVHDRGLFRKA